MDALYLITLLGDPVLWLAFSSILVLLYYTVRYKIPARRASLRSLIHVLFPAIWLAVGIVVLIKVGYPIPRPCTPLENPFCAIDPSFPSGHATAAFAGITSFVLGLGNRRLLALTIIPILVAYSRVALGVHTIPDVAGGALIGIAAPLAIIWAEKHLFRELDVKLG